MKTSKWVGLRVKANHPRGGHITGVVVKAEREAGRGNVLTLDTGQTIVANDIVETIDPPKQFYVSTYCNFAHSMKTGRPIGHECLHIPTAALRLEREGLFSRKVSLSCMGKSRNDTDTAPRPGIGCFRSRSERIRSGSTNAPRRLPGT